MNDLDIDETLPGQEIEEDSKEEVIRRENSISMPNILRENNANLRNFSV